MSVLPSYPDTSGLLPCPFCGCPGQEFKDFWDSGQIDCFGCKDCGISFERADEWNRRDGAPPPLSAAQRPLDRDQIAKIIFAHACGLSRWDDQFYAEERAGCLETADALVTALSIPSTSQNTAAQGE